MIVVRLNAAAPDKPVAGAPCNGCGACCAAAPCPVSRWLLGHRRGACPALAWARDEGRYRCAVLVTPAATLGWLPRALERPARRLVARWIAAGHGCDFDAEVTSAEPLAVD